MRRLDTTKKNTIYLLDAARTVLILVVALLNTYSNYFINKILFSFSSRFLFFVNTFHFQPYTSIQKLLFLILLFPAYSLAHEFRHINTSDFHVYVQQNQHSKTLRHTVQNFHEISRWKYVTATAELFLYRSRFENSIGELNLKNYYHRIFSPWQYMDKV